MNFKLSKDLDVSSNGEVEASRNLRMSIVPSAIPPKPVILNQDSYTPSHTAMSFSFSPLDFNQVGTPSLALESPDMFSTPSDSLCDPNASFDESFCEFSPNSLEKSNVKTPSYLRYRTLEKARGMGALKSLSFKASQDLKSTYPTKS